MPPSRRRMSRWPSPQTRMTRCCTVGLFVSGSHHPSRTSLTTLLSVQWAISTDIILNSLTQTDYSDSPVVLSVSYFLYSYTYFCRFLCYNLIIVHHFHFKTLIVTSIFYRFIILFRLFIDLETCCCYIFLNLPVVALGLYWFRPSLIQYRYSFAFHPFL